MEIAILQDSFREWWRGAGFLLACFVVLLFNLAIESSKWCLCIDYFSLLVLFGLRLVSVKETDWSCRLSAFDSRNFWVPEEFVSFFLGFWKFFSCLVRGFICGRCLFTILLWLILWGLRIFWCRLRWFFVFCWVWWCLFGLVELFGKLYKLKKNFSWRFKK